jgi:hypothetical protein
MIEAGSSLRLVMKAAAPRRAHQNIRVWDFQGDFSPEERVEGKEDNAEPAAAQLTPNLETAQVLERLWGGPLFLEPVG